MHDPDSQFRRYDPDQTTIVPHDLRDWLSEGHLAYFMRDVMLRIDLESFYAYYNHDGRGCVPYHPRMMVTIILYAYATRINSARKMSRMLYSNVAFRYLVGDNPPTTAPSTSSVCATATPWAGYCSRSCTWPANPAWHGMGIVCLDGTKIKANASMAANRDRDGIDEKAKRHFEEYLKKSKEIDDQENAEFGEGENGFTIPASFGGRAAMRRRLDEAKKQINAEEAKLR